MTKLLECIRPLPFDIHALALLVVVVGCSGAGQASGVGGPLAIQLAPKAVTTVPGAIVDFSAKILDAHGNSAPLTGASWSSSNTGILQVTSDGTASAKSVGSTWVAVAVGDLRDSALVTIDASPPPPSPTCTNEPTGLTPVTDQPWNAVPPMLNAVDGFGWGVDRDPENLAIVSDSTAPRSPSNVVHGIFPAGASGGTAPFRVERPFGGTQTYTTIFECVWMMHSPNFTDNGNIGTKVSFYRGPGQNHYWGFESGSGTDQFFFLVELQGGGGDRTMRATWSAKPLGVWHKYEILTVSNTPGQNNGILRVWADGQLILQFTDVAYWAATQTPGWTGVAWEPVYGGGLHPVPVTMFQAMDHWYVSAK